MPCSRSQNVLSRSEYFVLDTNMNFKTFFHVGPPRDFDLFKTFESQKTGKINNCDIALVFKTIRSSLDKIPKAKLQGQILSQKFQIKHF